MLVSTLKLSPTARDAASAATCAPLRGGMTWRFAAPGRDSSQHQKSAAPSNGQPRRGIAGTESTANGLSRRAETVIARAVRPTHTQATGFEGP
jgi:hypothetical protein